MAEYAKKILKNGIKKSTFINFFRFVFGKRGFIKYYIFYPLKSRYRVIRAKIDKKYLEKEKRLKNCHFGEVCFIVANGPSLTLEDLDAIYESKVISIGMNTAYKVYDKTKWRPEYYICIDLEGIEYISNSNDVKNIDELAKNIFFIDSESRRNFTDTKIVKIFFNRQVHGWKIIDDDFRYSDNLIYGLYDYYTSTNTAIILAKYMGFKNVYIIGCDCNRASSQKHSNGMESSLDDCLTEEYSAYTDIQQLKGLAYIAKELQKSPDFHVYNVTRGGNLEAFPRFDFDDVINEFKHKNDLLLTGDKT